MAASNKNEKQVMDVSKPGKAAPSATAKPVIVGHGPMVQDPMVTTDTETNEETEVNEQKTVASPSATKKVIAPISEQPSVESEKSEEPTEAEKIQESSTEEAAVVDAVIDQVGDKQQPAEPNEEDKKKQEHLEKLITEKKYYVPLGKVNGKSGHGLLIVTLLLLLVFLGLLVAIDSGALDPGFDLPIDLIKN